MGLPGPADQHTSLPPHPSFLVAPNLLTIVSDLNHLLFHHAEIANELDEVLHTRVELRIRHILLLAVTAVGRGVARVILNGIFIAGVIALQQSVLP